MKKILLENALESWASAIYYCDEIIAGKATLANNDYSQGTAPPIA